MIENAVLTLRAAGRDVQEHQAAEGGAQDE